MCETESGEMDVLPNGAPESFDSSEFSLIPSPPPHSPQLPLPAEGEGGQPGPPPAHLLSATFDLSEEEIQKRLLELAEDNRSLRESLQSSSAVMRSELSAIASWHHSVTSTIAQHKMDLQEAHARVQQLEKEKAQLLEKMQNSDKVENSTVLSDEDSEYEFIQKKSKDTESLRSQLKDAELKISTLKQEVEEQNLKIESMRNLFEEKEKEENDLKLKLENQDELNSKLCDLLKQLAASEETNNALKSKMKLLEEQLQSQKGTPALPMNDELLLTQAEEHLEEVKVLKEGHAKVVRDLEDKVRGLEEKLLQEQRASETNRLKNLEDKKLLSNLQSNYDRVTKILQMQSRKEKQKSESMDSECKRSQEEIDLLTARLFDCEQRLEESQQQVEMLTGELRLAREDSEQPAVLKAQVEVLKIDLDNAVLAKEAAQEELLQASQHLKELQAQSTASFCSNCGAGSAHGESPSRGGRGKRRTHSKSGGPDLFICPICQFGFTELQALENHVNTCIDKAQ